MTDQHDHDAGGHEPPALAAEPGETDYADRLDAHAALIAGRLSALLPDGYRFGFSSEPILMPEATASFDRLGEPSAVKDELLATKQVGYIEVPGELLMDYGVIPDTRERKPVPWRRRLRWRTADWRDRAAGLAYRLISGHAVPEMEE